jgi:hypothetical protein
MTTNLYLWAAYGIFCAIPVGLAISLAVRRRRVQRQMGEEVGAQGKIAERI